MSSRARRNDRTQTRFWGLPGREIVEHHTLQLCQGRDLGHVPARCKHINRVRWYSTDVEYCGLLAQLRVCATPNLLPYRLLLRPLHLNCLLSLFRSDPPSPDLAAALSQIFLEATYYLHYRLYDFWLRSTCGHPARAVVLLFHHYSSLPTHITVSFCYKGSQTWKQIREEGALRLHWVISIIAVWFSIL